MRVLLLFLLSIGLAACSAAGVSGSVNGVEFRSAVHRPAVPGGTKISIAVHMLEGSATGIDLARLPRPGDCPLVLMTSDDTDAPTRAPPKRAILGALRSSHFVLPCVVVALWRHGLAHVTLPSVVLAPWRHDLAQAEYGLVMCVGWWVS